LIPLKHQLLFHDYNQSLHLYFFPLVSSNFQFCFTVKSLATYSHHYYKYTHSHRHNLTRRIISQLRIISVCISLPMVSTYITDARGLSCCFYQTFQSIPFPSWPKTSLFQTQKRFKGLKIHVSCIPSLPSFTSTTSRVCSRQPGGGIVCDSQHVALDLPTVTDATWQSLVLNADGLVMVEFWAPWCGACRVIHPVIGELADEYNGKLKCYKLNTDDSPSIATQYGIRSIPTILFFINGEMKDAILGAVPKTTLIATIEKLL
ncbi:Thioredoxin domain-containing protein, partial [Cephalotus follicularis]